MRILKNLRVLFFCQILIYLCVVKKNLGLIVGATTFSLFMAEALIHYNMGVSEKEPDNKFTIPPKSDLIKLALVVGVFSFLNGVIVDRVKKTL